jgi:hypothetical protein
MKLLLRLLVVGAVPLASAHEGHGMAGTHWHATDPLGFVVLAAVIAGALWVARRK